MNDSCLQNHPPFTVKTVKGRVLATAVRTLDEARLLASEYANGSARSEAITVVDAKDRVVHGEPARGEHERYDLLLGGAKPESVPVPEYAVLLGLTASLSMLCDKLGLDKTRFRVTLDLPCGKKVCFQWKKPT